MKTKLYLALIAATLLITFSSFNAQATDTENNDSTQTSSEMPTQPIKGIGIVIIDSQDSSRVILLTKVPVSGNPEGKMIGIPILLDDNGKQLVEEYGIIGVSPDEENGMDRIQKESETKVVFVEGLLKFNEGMGVLEVGKYGSALEMSKAAK